jgi:hypothetical protein
MSGKLTMENKSGKVDTDYNPSPLRGEGRVRVTRNDSAECRLQIGECRMMNPEIPLRLLPLEKRDKNEGEE